MTDADTSTPRIEPVDEVSPELEEILKGALLRSSSASHCSPASFSTKE